MSEPSVEEIVAEIERMADSGNYPTLTTRVRVLIASWRERGEALRQIAEGQMVGYEAQTIARAALKDKP